ncbi:MAG: tRNA (adenosine(37)-N6)-threonylcarbamoyltransferase complex ATPase subunit type 1 TsaE [Yaniella sp.]|uniref:tRNA (adenosine(37)-N6)-threonylcarbamoyltransferase complex ATPase subunit type 1 TsaE n=1 Tax=Yaniella sp. TaxID=2773929 RepID=UPI0026490ED2|nr:tRNA (adenosine(37)-N6)-threonylcarbamoyltransferase complex ATPase subunit type 1 TsaE [Yaniella sp.]MDN5730467.1 tRNA (adenosine(37)-N6)-threonylcarbamoyltransferase complex ATPase subunit type 1 TsaE [Yaniella sp.]MDN5743096.1 tRNA (adenosine(37)-N6)-threonylcarbamoyltransferase complex ATPase subunit type 1 TsaE [Yaniella sp.]MDN5815688.1 tRNA (adenosine(37)-N6)-threonylcarbamoyltransferase complex ATPase subunit type 1 TsaE [Yaniella sp.]MDN5816899.1 tRNA (adenosine(37)-N6)-threonylcarb
MEYTADLADLAATKNFALAVANQLQAGDVIILTGELGAGKTTFTQGLARGLGITAPITSPTFVLARHHVHPADGLDLVHVDAYRMSGEDELASLDLETALEDSVIVVEWGRGTAEALTDAYLDIELQRPGAVTDELITDFSDDDVEEPRTVVVTGYGPRWQGSSLV